MNTFSKIIIPLIAVAALGFSIWSKVSVPKVGYVKTGVVVNDYSGMKEARMLYQKKAEGWQANFDTLERDYQRAVSKFNLEMSKLSREEKMMKEDNLRKQQMNIEQYSRALEEKAKGEDEKLTQGVLNQINAYILEYGKNHHYDVILGLTSGNVLYGSESIDLTKEILDGLNENYKGKTK